jgi:malate synthase
MREVCDGHDGTWVAHPGLIPIAMEVFDTHMKESNQIHKHLDNLNGPIEAQDLLCVPKGTCTEAALRKNIKIGFEYLKAWVNGNGCVPLNNLMEDAATAEISRAQIWQWRRHNVQLDNGHKVTSSYLRQVLKEELSDEEGQARNLFESLCLSEKLSDFLTLEAYKEL